jgi:hypothetical protein
MAVTDYPEIGTRVEGNWVHPLGPEFGTERTVGTVVTMEEAYKNGIREQYEAQGDTLTDDEVNDKYDRLAAAGVFEGHIGIKVESSEATYDTTGLASSYVHFSYGDVTILPAS